MHIPLQPLAPPPRVEGGWRWRRLLSAPHRLGFFVAALGLGLSAAWWLLVMLARQGGWPLPWAVAPGLAHGLLLGGGFMPLFIVGFEFTAGPRWLGLPEVLAPELLPAVAWMGGGWLLALVGFHLQAELAALGLLAVAWGWGRALARFAGLVRASRVPDRLHASGVALAGAVGLLALLLAAAGLAGSPWLLRGAVQLMLWGWLAPTFVIVSHRMLPFFSAAALPGLEVWRPNALLGAMLGALGLGGVAEAGALLGWTGPWPWQVVSAALLGGAGLGLLLLAGRWGLLHSLRGPSLRLLAMLHGGFVWLGLVLLLAGLSQALRAAGLPDLGLAPLHALTLGYLGGTLIAMATRVAAGHSGRALAVDAWAWRFYLLLQATVLLRLAAALNLLPLWPAALGWALVALAWTLRHGRWLGEPRVDGRPG